MKSDLASVVFVVGCIIAIIILLGIGATLLGA